MIAILKLAGLSAVLSTGVVTAYEMPKPAAADLSGKIYQDRIRPDMPEVAVYADALQAMPAATVASDASPTPPPCRAQTWPYVTETCLSGQDGSPARRVVRTITIERRDVPNVSTLVRLPTAPVAIR